MQRDLNLQRSTLIRIQDSPLGFAITQARIWKLTVLAALSLTCLLDSTDQRSAPVYM